MENLENLTKINVSFEYKISYLDIFGGHFVHLTLFCPKNSREVQNFRAEKGDVLEKNVIRDSKKNWM
jgi:hypothetical protein